MRPAKLINALSSQPVRQKCSAPSGNAAVARIAPGAAVAAAPNRNDRQKFDCSAGRRNLDSNRFACAHLEGLQFRKRRANAPAGVGAVAAAEKTRPASEWAFSHLVQDFAPAAAAQNRVARCRRRRRLCLASERDVARLLRDGVAPNVVVAAVAAAHVVVFKVTLWAGRSRRPEVAPAAAAASNLACRLQCRRASAACESS